MSRNLSTEQKGELQSQGATISGIIGGSKKTLYYTPDGREVWATPSTRGFVRKKKGKVIGEGTRDANLDRGWLLQPPVKLKPYCTHCGNWHDTKDEVDACGAARKATQDRWVREAEEQKRKAGGEFEAVKEDVLELKTDMSEIKNMLMKLLEKKR